MRAIAELKLTLLAVGQDGELGNYTEQGSGFDYDAPDGAKCYWPVPGVELNQLAESNQVLLRGASEVLAGLQEDDEITHGGSVTANGAHGDKPEYFVVAPLFLNGWPS